MTGLLLPSQLNQGHECVSRLWWLWGKLPPLGAPPLLGFSFLGSFSARDCSFCYCRRLVEQMYREAFSPSRPFLSLEDLLPGPTQVCGDAWVQLQVRGRRRVAQGRVAHAGRCCCGPVVTVQIPAPAGLFSGHSSLGAGGGEGCLQTFCLRVG